METKLFQSLKEEIKRNYGFTKRSINFIPFEDWRRKLRAYPNEFDEEYAENLNILRKKLKLNGLQEVKNPNKRLILFLGIPGAGKTTLAHIVQKSVPNTILLRGHDVIEMLDLYGEKLEKYEQRLRRRGFTNPDPWYISYLYQEHLTRDCLQLGYNVVFDDHIRTRINRLGYYNLAKKCNSGIYNLAKKCNSGIVFVQINAPFATYLEREEDDKDKLKFLANMVLQSEDISEAERRKYDKIVEVDGTSKLRELERDLKSQMKRV